MPDSWTSAFESEQESKFDASADATVRVRWLRGLDRVAGPNIPSIARRLAGFSWLQVTGVGHLSTGGVQLSPISPLPALSRLGPTIAFLLTGQRREVSMYWGTENRKSDALQGVLTAAWPATGMRPLPTLPPLGIESLKTLVCSGYPAPRPADQLASIDLLLRGMQPTQERWAYVAIMSPVPYDSLHAWHERTLEQMADSRQRSLQADITGQGGRSHRAHEELLDAWQRLLVEAMSTGGWLTLTAALGSTAVLPLLESALSAAFGNGSVYPELWRIRRAAGEAPVKWFDVLTLYPSTVLSQLTGAPLDEHPGLPVSHVVRFGLTPPVFEDAPRRGITLGQVLDGRRPLHAQFQLSADSLAGHTLIAGRNGSGKTTTAKALAGLVTDRHVPVIIFEANRHDYGLLQLPALEVVHPGATTAGVPLNPLAFEPGDAASGGLAAHSHALVQLMSGAFGLTAAQTALLERGLEGVYADRGWDLVSGRCWRSPAGHPRAWPTMAELTAKVAELSAARETDRVSDAADAATVATHLHRLTSGAAWTGIEERNAIGYGGLLATPKLFELSWLADPAHRTFVAGLVLTKILEAVSRSGSSRRLRALLVLEDASEFLGADNGCANAASRWMTSVLGRLRTYGVGAVLVEPNPVRLPREVLQNCAIKIAHQLVDAADRDAVAGSMLMTAAEGHGFATLAEGDAVVFAPGMQRPVAVQVHPWAAQPGAPDTPAEPAVAPQAHEETAIAELLARRATVEDALLRCAYALTFEKPPLVRAAWLDYLGAIAAESPLTIRDQQALASIAVAVAHSTAEVYSAQLGVWYAWPFVIEEEAVQLFMASVERLAGTDGTELGPFAGWLAPALTGVKPFAGCEDRPRPCAYRAFVRLAKADSHWPWVNAINAALSASEPGWVALLERFRDWAGNIAPVDAPTRPHLLRCLSAHQAYGMGLSSAQQLVFVRRVVNGVK